MGMGAMDHDVGLQSGPVPEGAAEIYRVAQSGDATCNGLFSPMEGSRTMTLMKGKRNWYVTSSILQTIQLQIFRSNDRFKKKSIKSKVEALGAE